MGKNNLVVHPDELAFTMSRRFDVPRERLWQVMSDPALIPHWWGPRRLTTAVDRMDWQVGGKWRFVQRDAHGNEFAFNGIYKQIKPPERLSYTFEFEPMAGHISTDTITLDSQPDGTTLVTSRTTFDSLDDLEGMLQSDMEAGATETWDRLEELAVG